RVAVVGCWSNLAAAASLLAGSGGGSYRLRGGAQTRMVMSLLPDTKRVPSGVQTTQGTESVWPVYLSSSLPLSMSHRQKYLSWPEVSSRWPPGDTATNQTLCVWPLM